MRSSVMHTAGGSFSFNGKTAYGPYVATTLERVRYHLFRNVIPTVLILVGASWISLLLTEQIYEAKLARGERPSVEFPQRLAMNVQGRLTP